MTDPHDSKRGEGETSLFVRMMQALRGPHFMEQLSALFLEKTRKFRNKMEGSGAGEQGANTPQHPEGEHAPGANPILNHTQQVNHVNQFNQSNRFNQLNQVNVVVVQQSPADTVAPPLTEHGNLLLPPKHVSRAREPAREHTAGEHLDRQERRERSLAKDDRSPSPRRSRGRR